MYIPDRFTHQYGIPLIMEVGSLNTKIGFAGKDRPDVVAPSGLKIISSMCRSIGRQGRRQSWIFTKASLKKTVTHNQFYKIALSKIGKGSKH